MKIIVCSYWIKITNPITIVANAVNLIGLDVFPRLGRLYPII